MTVFFVRMYKLAYLLTSLLTFTSGHLAMKLFKVDKKCYRSVGKHTGCLYWSNVMLITNAKEAVFYPAFVCLSVNNVT